MRVLWSLSEGAGNAAAYAVTADLTPMVAAIIMNPAIMVSTMVPPTGRLNAHEKYRPATEHTHPKEGEKNIMVLNFLQTRRAAATNLTGFRWVTECVIYNHKSVQNSVSPACFWRFCQSGAVTAVWGSGRVLFRS